MLKRDYTHIKIPEPEILAMKKANVLIDNYINFYNHRRIRLKTGVVPLTLRHSA